MVRRSCHLDSAVAGLPSGISRISFSEFLLEMDIMLFFWGGGGGGEGTFDIARTLGLSTLKRSFKVINFSGRGKLA